MGRVANFGKRDAQLNAGAAPPAPVSPAAVSRAMILGVAGALLVSVIVLALTLVTRGG